MLTPQTAALLVTLLNARLSLVVISEQGGAGKTTLLSALLDGVPASVNRIYLRGAYEPFDFVGQAEPETSIVLINELSPHLPIYLWGPPVGRALELGRGGYQLAATAHGRSVEDWIASLCRSPLRLPLELILAFDLAVLIETATTPHGLQRVVATVVGLAPGTTSGSLRPIPLQASAGAALDHDQLAEFLAAHDLDPVSTAQQITIEADRVAPDAGDGGDSESSPNG